MKQGVENFKHSRKTNKVLSGLSQYFSGVKWNFFLEITDTVNILSEF